LKEEKINLQANLQSINGRIKDLEAQVGIVDEEEAFKE